MTGQVSIEFLTLFAALLIIFIIGIASIPTDYTDSEKHTANNALNTLKLHLLTASTTQGTYQACIDIPPRIDGRNVEIRVHGAPDNIASLATDQAVLSQVNLPTITTVKDKNSFPCDGDTSTPLTNRIAINKTDTIEVYT